MLPIFCGKRRLKNKSILVFLLAFTLVTTVGRLEGSNTAKAAEPVWDQAVVDQAVNESLLVRFSTGTPNSKGGWDNNILQTAEAMYFLALVSHYNPDLKCTSGTQKGVKVSDRLLLNIRNMIKAGYEPSCRGGISGWSDNQAAQTLALAKQTPVIWSQLTDAEKLKCDFIMKCLTVAGNYCHNYSNKPKLDLSQINWWEKGWNPNHIEGYVGVMIAAHIYFGGAANVNAFLDAFNFDEYIATAGSYGFSNIIDTFNKAGKTRMETGGTDANGGVTYGVRLPFTYKDLSGGGRIAYDPFLLYKSLAIKMFCWTENSTTTLGSMRNGGKVYQTDGTMRGSIMDGTTSPYYNQMGICYEYLTSDASGIRTSSSYVFEGLRNHMINRATLQATDNWYPGADGVTLKSRMNVGVEDWLYKMVHGYSGWSNGTPANTTGEMGYVLGYNYIKQIWNNYLKNFYTPVAGDINGDGTIDITDVVITAEIAVGTGGYTDMENKRANVDSKTNAVVDISDVVLIAERAVGGTDVFPVDLP